MNTPSRALVCCRHNRKGTGQFTFISLNSLNSSWRRKGCKMNEKMSRGFLNSKEQVSDDQRNRGVCVGELGFL